MKIQKHPNGVKMKMLSIIIFIVFLSASALNMSIFYEGLMLKWFDFVPVLILITDISFILATVLSLLLNKKNRVIFFLNILSVLFICIAVLFAVLKIDYPKWCFVLWNFYILYFYGTQAAINIYKCIKSKNVT